MISSFQNFSGAATAAAAYNPMAYSHHAAGHGQQLHSVYGAVAAAAQQAAYNAGQQPVAYHPADYGSPPPQPSRHYESPNRRPMTTTEPPNRKKPVPQQPPVQFTRVQGGVPGGTYIKNKYDLIRLYCRCCCFCCVVLRSFDDVAYIPKVADKGG